MSEAGKPGAKAVPASTSEPLARLRRGEITIDEYVDFCVEHATRHLKGLMTADQLQVVRETLEFQLQNDPVLTEYFRSVTGRDAVIGR